MDEWLKDLLIALSVIFIIIVPPYVFTTPKIQKVKKNE